MIGIFKGIISASVLAYLKQFYHVYLFATAPIERNGATKVLDEGAKDEPNRAELYSRCLLGDGTSTIDFSLAFPTGTLTLKGWTKESGVWGYRDITAGLSSKVLTLQSNVYYLSFEIYINAVLVAKSLIENASKGSTISRIILDRIIPPNINSLNITSTNISNVREVENNAPLLNESGDIVGYEQSLYKFNPLSASGYSYIDTLDANTITGTNNFTITFLAQVATTYGGFSCFIDKGFVDGIEILWAGSGGGVRMWFNSTRVLNDVPIPTTVNLFNRYTFRRLGNDLQFEFNGVLITTVDVTGKSIGTANNWAIASQLYPNENYQFVGAMGDVRFYDTNITHTQIINNSIQPIRHWQPFNTDWVDTITGDSAFIGNNSLGSGVETFPQGVTNNEPIAIKYLGRKAQNLTVGGAGILLDTARTTEIQCSQSLTGVTVNAVYGENAITGKQLVIADIGIDDVNNKLYNNNASGDDIKVAGVKLDDGRELWFTGNTSGDSELLTDISGNNDHATVLSTDIVAANSTQKFFNIMVLNGFTTQTDGSTIEYVPCKSDGTPITHSGFTISDTYVKGTHIHSQFISYIYSSNYKTLDLALQSNEEIYESTTDVNGNSIIKKLHVPISLKHADRNFTATTLIHSVGDYIQGDVTEDWSTVPVTIDEYEGDPAFSTADFTIDTVNNRISTVSADAQFAQLTLSNGNKYYRDSEDLVIKNGKEGGNNASLVCADSADCYTTQNYWNYDVEYNPDLARNKALKLTGNA